MFQMANLRPYSLRPSVAFGEGLILRETASATGRSLGLSGRITGVQVGAGETAAGQGSADDRRGAGKGYRVVKGKLDMLGVGRSGQLGAQRHEPGIIVPVVLDDRGDCAGRSA